MSSLLDAIKYSERQGAAGSGLHMVQTLLTCDPPRLDQEMYTAGGWGVLR